jgi:hypothetical protein
MAGGYSLVVIFQFIMFCCSAETLSRFWEKERIAGSGLFYYSIYYGMLTITSKPPQYREEAGSFQYSGTHEQIFSMLL